ncbi:MAG TPA: acyltransferase, partial [Acidobacteriaceae bacterium]|nr:acyltransferase [Acidobacteriaceae bacterium]
VAKSAACLDVLYKAMVPQLDTANMQRRRIPSLDGLRAVSIVLVVGVHSLQRYSIGHTVSLVYYVLLNGALGVQIFFVISGFLITNLLLQERRKTGTISLSEFYIRRVFRILPPLYTYIAVIGLIGLWGGFELNRSDFISGIFFFHNLSRSTSMWSLQHLWSISVEEQFYLVWPFVLCAFLKGDSEKDRMMASVFPIAVLLVSPPLRTILGLQRSHPLLRDFGFRINYDFIMFGCLIALLQGTERFEEFYRRATQIWWLPLLTVFGLGAISMRFQHYFDLPIGYTLTGAAVALSVLWCTRNADHRVGKILNWRPIVWVGVLSYSIYLWQTLFLHHLNYEAFGRYSWIGAFPVNWIAIMLAATFSYYAIEQAALRLRVKLLDALRAYKAARVRPVTQ